MAVVMGLGEVALQTLLALLTFRGFGEVLASLRLIPSRDVRFTHFYRATAGLAGSTLLLLAGVYAGIPIRYSAWIVLAVAVTGLGLWFWQYRTEAPRAQRFAQEEHWAMGAFLAVFLLQGIPLFWIGPGHYFSTGKPDYLQYTVCSQFLVEESIYTTASEAPEKAWVVTAQRVIHDRLGQNIPISYLSTILQSHAQRVIGTVFVLYLAWLSAATFACLRELNVTLPLAWMGALWTGIAHFISYSTNSAFLSNSSILFVLPAFAAMAWRYRQTPERMRLFPALLLAYAFCCYTEIAPFLMLTAALCWGGLVWRKPAPALRLIAITLAAIVLLSSPYLSQAVGFLSRQFEHGIHRSYEWQIGYAGKSGTWTGWKDLFFANLEGRRAYWINQSLVLASIGMIGVAILGCLNGSPLKRHLITRLIIGSGGYLILLRLWPDFHAYVFFKLSVTYLPIFIIAIVYGFQILCTANRSRLIHGIVAVLVLLSILSSVMGWQMVLRAHGTRSYDQPSLLATYDYVSRHREQTYFITDRNYYRASWLMYFARRSKVYCAYAAPVGLVEPTIPPSILPAPESPYVILDGETVPAESEIAR